MKKLLTLLLTLLMAFTLVGCGNNGMEEKPVDVPIAEVNEPVQEELVGGFIDVEDGTLTDELKDIFNKAIDGLLGATYEPVELVATQVVAGTNYKFLANGTKTTNPITKGAYYITVYEDLDGNVSLLDIETIEEKQEETFDSTQYSYWVVFRNPDGNELQRTIEKYGTTPVYTGDTPAYWDSENWYRFTNWDKELKPITGNTYITAEYEFGGELKQEKDEPAPAPVRCEYYGSTHLIFIRGNKGELGASASNYPVYAFDYDTTGYVLDNSTTEWNDTTSLEPNIGEWIHLDESNNVVGECTTDGDDAKLPAIKYLTWNGSALVEKETYRYIEITNSTSTLNSGFYVANGTITTGTLTVNGTATLILCNSTTLTSTGASNFAGIDVSTGNSLTITTPEFGTGKLIAIGGDRAAGIGGNDLCSAGTIVFNGGSITATSKDNYIGGSASAIGGGFNGNGATVVINGGTVEATAGFGGKAIGAGSVATNDGSISFASGKTFEISAGDASPGNTVTQDSYIAQHNQKYVKIKDPAACLAKGTLITMADGSRKPVETLQEGDDIRVFDHNTGKLSHAKIMDYWQYEQPQYGLMTLHFTNNIDVNIVGAHSFFNKQENKYITITSENVNDYIGKQFYNADDACWETLLGVTYSSEPVDTFFIATEDQFDCIAEGMLTMEDGIYTLVADIFDYDANMKVNVFKKYLDILRYGLFTSKDIPAITENAIKAYKLQYIKVAIGKGIITKDIWDMIVKEMITYESDNVNEGYIPSEQKHSAK